MGGKNIYIQEKEIKRTTSSYRKKNDQQTTGICNKDSYCSIDVIRSIDYTYDALRQNIKLTSQTKLVSFKPSFSYFRDRCTESYFVYCHMVYELSPIRCQGIQICHKHLQRKQVPVLLESLSTQCSFYHSSLADNRWVYVCLFKPVCNQKVHELRRNLDMDCSFSSSHLYKCEFYLVSLLTNY